MYDELTAVDIQKMQEEINYRVRELRPQLIEEVQTARAFGDLSENYEYKCAKQAKNRNDSRIRYLERMIRTAKVIEVKETADAVGLFDTVTVYNEMMKKEMIVRIVTTLRQDALKGLISKESPVGQALMGRRTGERVEVAVSPEMKYTLEIRKIEKGSDDESLEKSLNALEKAFLEQVDKAVGERMKGAAPRSGESALYAGQLRSALGLK